MQLSNRRAASNNAKVRHVKTPKIRRQLYTQQAAGTRGLTNRHQNVRIREAHTPMRMRNGVNVMLVRIGASQCESDGVSEIYDSSDRVGQKRR